MKPRCSRRLCRASAGGAPRSPRHTGTRRVRLTRAVPETVPRATTAVTVSDTRANAGAALVSAAQRGDLAAVKSLIAEGADVNVPQGDGMTALHWAAHHGDTAMATDCCASRGRP